MQVNVSDLVDIGLDWAVAVCEGVVCVREGGHDVIFSPSTKWAHGGPIIEREHIRFSPTFTEGGYRTSNSIDAVHAAIDLPNGATQFNPEKAVWEYGPTPLIAAMRCYVASKMGDIIELPDELFNQA